MPSRRQQSKRDRGREHEGLPPKREPKYGYCDQCGQAIHNRGAHAEACSGTRFTGWYAAAGTCSCGWRQTGGRCVHGNPYVPVIRSQHEGVWKEPSKR